MSQVQFLTVKEAAEFLRVAVATVYRWVYERRIPYRKHGSRLVFCGDDLKRWSVEQAVAPHEASTSISDLSGIVARWRKEQQDQRGIPDRRVSRRPKRGRK